MKNKKAFTLVELMIVIAIIGALAGLLVPMVSNAMRTATAGKSKTFMQGLLSAMNDYKTEMGAYPDFVKAGTRINLNDGDNALILFKCLTGKNPDGDLSAEDRYSYNPDKKTFFSFSDDNIKKINGKWKIVDAFENPNIYICVAEDGEELIKEGLPTTKDGIDSDELDSIIPNKELGVRAKAVIFTLQKDAGDSDAENVFSWQK